AAQHRGAPAPAPLAAGTAAAGAGAVHERPGAADAAAPDLSVGIPLAAAGPHLPARFCRATCPGVARSALEKTVGPCAPDGRAGTALVPGQAWRRGSFLQRACLRFIHLRLATSAIDN